MNILIKYSQRSKMSLYTNITLFLQKAFELFNIKRDKSLRSNLKIFFMNIYKVSRESKDTLCIIIILDNT